MVRGAWTSGPCSAAHSLHELKRSHLEKSSRALSAKRCNGISGCNQETGLKAAGKDRDREREQDSDDSTWRTRYGEERAQHGVHDSICGSG